MYEFLDCYMDIQVQGGKNTSSPGVKPGSPGAKASMLLNIGDYYTIVIKLKVL